MSATTGCRTVVLGRGIAGSLAARVAVRAGHQVGVVDRRSRGQSGSRATQLHNLLGRAQRELEHLVPGFAEAFAKAGGQRAEVATGTHVFEAGREMPERRLGLEVWSAPVELIERLVDDGLRAEVEHLDRRSAVGLVVDRGRVTGVRLDDRVVECDLVIDALGSASPVASWTGATIPVTQVRSRQWYVSVPVRRPVAYWGCDDFWMIFPTWPQTRGGLISPTSAETWTVSVSGAGPDAAPRTWAELVAYTADLERPWIRDLLDGVEPLGEPTQYGRPTATWRHYDRAPSSPVGLIPVGDAVAALNPLQGQGISVAAAQISGLWSLLTDEGDLTELTARHHAQAAAIAREAWQVMTLTSDHPSGPAPTPAQWESLLERVADDPVVHRAYVEVWHLLRPAAELLELATGAMVG